MNVCLIDADSVIPNIPLMRLATYHKDKGDRVTLVKANLPYYPVRKKIPYREVMGSDLTYASVVFSGNKEYIRGRNIIFGGTGVDLKTELSEEVEMCEPDYNMYPNNDTSYGFISRGCIRNCSFCVVQKKEGKIRQVSTIDAIVRHKKVKFLDNNIMALPNHKEIFRELIAKKIKCRFTAGLDIRLVDKENSELLHKLNYIDDYVFAFDSLSIMPILEKNINILSWRKPWDLKFCVYIHPDMPLSETIQRIEWLKERECLSFAMRDISCWKSKYSDFYTDVTSYCNRPVIYKNLTFIEFMKGIHIKEPVKTNGLRFLTDEELVECNDGHTKTRIEANIELYKSNM
jgi:hypothetical protein